MSEVETIAQLERKLQIITDVVAKLRTRNDNLTSQFRAPVERRPPFRPSFPSSTLLSDYFEASRHFRLLERKHERLSQATKLLDRRIDDSNRLLRQHQQETAIRSVRTLSPTAAQLLHSSAPPPSPSHFVELTMFQTQLEAIRALKTGAVPKPPGGISVDFPAEIAAKQEILGRHSEKTKQLLEHLSASFARFYGEENGFGIQAGGRGRLSSAFSNFLSAYHRASYAIDTRPHRKLLAELRQRSIDERNAAIERIWNDLEIEKEFLLRELIARGGMDQEGTIMKKEIEVELMHLRHLAAIAGAVLARMSTQQAPIDPIESMQVDIAEREMD